MKAKKAMKRLHRVEALLGTVIDQYTDGAGQVHDFLDAARASITSATQALSESPAKKPAAAAERSQTRRLSNAARKKLSAAAKKRWAEAKSKGMSTLAKSTRKIA